ncbi:hypothetical protein LOK49_LG06G02992 [Camellia lanceoleosa]|uniref:Uncharacterized protein n=1 Tax=Camellia lanceoleosa TaxID=1840588 RepID=A0ACC0H808_9ERIC|nr:hypothetical protein LOK49_LG06G02992 [Camellia lanceoleosa]
MGSKAMFSIKFSWVLTLLLSVKPTMVQPQMQACSIQGIDLEQCLKQGENPISIESCCIVLNRAVQAGFYCLCSLLASSSPLPSTPLLLPLSTCFISAPPLSQCQALVPVLQPPPASPIFPVVLPPPDSPDEELPEPSAPTDLLVPPTPQEGRGPLIEASGINSTIATRWQPPLSNHAAPNLSVSRSGYLTSNGQDSEFSLLSRHSLLVVTLFHAYMM